MMVVVVYNIRELMILVTLFRFNEAGIVSVNVRLTKKKKCQCTAMM